MPLAVDSFVMGPFQSNCYVVRGERGAPEAAVVDPGDDPTELRLELARMGTTRRRASSSRTPTSTTSAASRRSPTEPAPRSGRRRARSRRSARGRRAAASPSLRTTRRTPSRAATRSPSPASPSRWSTSRATRAATSRSITTASSSPAICSSRARSDAYDLPGGDWETLLDSIRSLLERFPPETVVYPGHGPATTLGRELQTNPFLRELRAREREVPGAARDARRPAERTRTGGTSSARWKR